MPSAVTSPVAVAGKYMAGVTVVSSALRYTILLLCVTIAIVAASSHYAK